MVEKKHRLFIAIDFSEEVIAEVSRIGELLERQKFTGKLTELENLHLTLKFLGEVDEKKKEEIKKKLKEIKFSEFETRTEDIGTFSFRGMVRIVWIKIGGKGIFELQKKIDDKLEEIGFRREERFMSHMTIARVKYVKDKSGFVDYVKNIGLKELKFKVKDFKLKESELKLLGPVYTDLEVYS